MYASSDITILTCTPPPDFSLSGGHRVACSCAGNPRECTPVHYSFPPCPPERRYEKTTLFGYVDLSGVTHAFVLVLSIVSSSSSSSLDGNFKSYWSHRSWSGVKPASRSKPPMLYVVMIPSRDCCSWGRSVGARWSGWQWGRERDWWQCYSGWLPCSRESPCSSPWPDCTAWAGPAVTGCWDLLLRWGWTLR